MRIRIHGPGFCIRVQKRGRNSINLWLLLQTPTQFQLKQIWLIRILHKPLINHFIGEINRWFFYLWPTRSHQHGLCYLRWFSNLFRQECRECVKPFLLRLPRGQLQLWIFRADCVGQFFKRWLWRQTPLLDLLGSPRNKTRVKFVATHANCFLKCVALIQTLLVLFKQFRHGISAPLALQIFHHPTPLRVRQRSVLRRLWPHKRPFNFVQRK